MQAGLAVTRASRAAHADAQPIHTHPTHTRGRCLAPRAADNAAAQNNLYVIRAAVCGIYFKSTTRLVANGTEEITAMPFTQFSSVTGTTGLTRVTTPLSPDNIENFIPDTITEFVFATPQ